MNLTFILILFCSVTAFAQTPTGDYFSESNGVPGFGNYTNSPEITQSNSAGTIGTCARGTMQGSTCVYMDNKLSAKIECPIGYYPSAYNKGECLPENSAGTAAVETNPLTGKVSAYGGACGDALSKLDSMCRGAKFSQYTPAIMAMASSVSAAKSSGNMKQACETAKKIQALTAASNGVVAGMCQTGITKCRRACKDEVGGPEECSTYDAYAQGATGQAVLSATAMAGSQACVEEAGSCLGEAAFSNPDCTQFCFKPQNQQHAKCVSQFNQCANPTYAAQNVQQCTCINNPLSPNCRNVTQTPPPGVVPGGTPDFSDDGGVGSDYDFTGSNAEGTPARTNAAQGSGGGGLGGGGGSYAMPGEGQQGTGDDPLNKDILTGQGGGAAGGAYYGGGGGYADGGSKGGSGSEKEKGFDLSAFLPGGKKDPKRNPASYGDPSITQANGLTNWQKVTRKMNEKRPELMP